MARRPAALDRLAGAFRHGLGDRSAATAVEYALVASIISVVIAGSFPTVTDALSGVYERVGDILTDASSGD